MPNLQPEYQAVVDGEVSRHNVSRQIRGFVAISLLAAMVSAAAQDRTATTVNMNAVGTHSCGKYLEFRKAGDYAMTNLFQQWRAGFLAAYSTAM